MKFKKSENDIYRFPKNTLDQFHVYEQLSFRKRILVLILTISESVNLMLL